MLTRGYTRDGGLSDFIFGSFYGLKIFDNNQMMFDKHRKIIMGSIFFISGNFLKSNFDFYRIQ